MEPHCHGCRSFLNPGSKVWMCEGCDRSYPALRGIPDLRTADDAYLSNQEDWAFARELDRSYDSLDFRGLLDRYFELAEEISAAQRSRQIAHILTAPGRAGQWLDCLGESAKIGPVLDLGCGSGSLLAAKAREVGPVVGVDIAMRWLILARKRLEEEGLGQIPLICGCAEDLPFSDGVFQAILAGDVIEHVNHQGDAIAEAHRVLGSRGRLFLATPNRFSLTPEAHVGVWGVGFLPRRWMKSYVKCMAGKDFRAIRTSGYREWKQLLDRSDFESFRIVSPPLPDADLSGFRPFKRYLATTYNRLVATSAGQAVANRVGPLFHVVAEKASRSSTRTIRPHSRSSKALW